MNKIFNFILLYVPTLISIIRLGIETKKQALKIIDINSDGKISFSEITNFLKNGNIEVTFPSPSDKENV